MSEERDKSHPLCASVWADQTLTSCVINYGSRSNPYRSLVCWLSPSRPRGQPPSLTNDSQTRAQGYALFVYLIDIDAIQGFIQYIYWLVVSIGLALNVYRLYKVNSPCVRARSSVLRKAVASCSTQAVLGALISFFHINASKHAPLAGVSSPPMAH